MLQLDIDEAKTRLADLVEAALSGQTVSITTSDDRAVQLVPMAQRRFRRQFGCARGLIVLSDDFDAPLPEFEEYMR